MQVDLKVVQLLSSRLCHDLVGPAGAVHNGIELFEEIGPGDEGAGAGALKIVTTSAEQLLARLAFFRMAFGLGGLSGRHHPLAEARDMTQAFLEGRKITLDWPPEIVTNMGQAIKAPAVKLLLNMILVAIDGLPRGGVLRVSVVSLCNPQDEPAIGMTVNAVGAGARLKKDLQLALSSQSLSQAQQGLSAHNIHGFFCQRLAEEQLSKIEFCVAQDTVQFTALIPQSA
jgi:histidine phosphotransferase ChpT